jgi:ABC-type glycerol-3-phosphate transport system substrate-binding protein
VDPNSKTFEKVIGLVQSFPVRGSFTYGAYILDPQAQQIGMWYSSLDAGITVNPETKVVFIIAAMPGVENGGWCGSGVGVGIGSGGGGVGVRLGF